MTSVKDELEHTKQSLKRTKREMITLEAVNKQVRRVFATVGMLLRRGV
jgi:hypothetical protein